MYVAGALIQVPSVTRSVRAAIAPSVTHGSVVPSVMESLTNTPSHPASSAATASSTTSVIPRTVG